MGPAEDSPVRRKYGGQPGTVPKPGQRSLETRLTLLRPAGAAKAYARWTSRAQPSTRANLQEGIALSPGQDAAWSGSVDHAVHHGRILRQIHESEYTSRSSPLNSPYAI